MAFADETASTASIGFGWGVHGRAWQGLARMEAHALLTALAEQIDRIESTPVACAACMRAACRYPANTTVAILRRVAALSLSAMPCC
jgi:hypothetical protein